MMLMAMHGPALTRGPLLQVLLLVMQWSILWCKLARVSVVTSPFLLLTHAARG